MKTEKTNQSGDSPSPSSTGSAAALIVQAIEELNRHIEKLPNRYCSFEAKKDRAKLVECLIKITQPSNHRI